MHEHCQSLSNKQMYRNTLLVFLDVISLTKQVPFPLIDIVQRIESELFYSLFACQPFVSTLVGL